MSDALCLIACVARLRGGDVTTIEPVVVRRKENGVMTDWLELRATQTEILLRPLRWDGAKVVRVTYRSHRSHKWNDRLPGTSSRTEDGVSYDELVAFGNVLSNAGGLNGASLDAISITSSQQVWVPEVLKHWHTGLPAGGVDGAAPPAPPALYASVSSRGEGYLPAVREPSC